LTGLTGPISADQSTFTSAAPAQSAASAIAFTIMFLFAMFCFSLFF
jgi:hypothetical protein